MEQQRNLIAAILISVAIVLGYQFLIEGPRLAREKALHPPAHETTQVEPAAPGTTPKPAAPGVTTAPHAPGAAAAPTAKSLGEILAESPRITIDTPRLKGSVALKGGRIDDLTLTDYHETVDRSSPPITLLTPPGTPDAYYADWGWVAAGGGSVKLPDATTLWQADRKTLTPDAPVTLTWDNGQGLKFVRVISVDSAYMFHVTQRVENSGPTAVTLFPYAFVSRSGNPPVSSYYLLYEGPIGVLGGTLKDEKYSTLKKDGPVEMTSTGGWLGFTDNYWLAAVIPDQHVPVRARFSDTITHGENKYQADYISVAGMTVEPGKSAELKSMMFAGAKEVSLLDSYESKLGITRFSYAIDWGWFFFLTKPIFYILDFLYHLVGNFGIAILLLTVIIKGLFFPLANKSYRAMSKLKQLQPEMTKIRERFADDKERMNKEMMELYKREKANPVSGCLPTVIQIPVFFALYKTLYVTIEMRHAPFYGWIHDLSAPDPTSVLNLFGAIPWTVPHSLGILDFVNIGAWPLIYGVTMFLQQKLNPQPVDPTQAKMFMILPVVFTFMLAHFPSGLVIYWAWSNCLSILQQWLIMRRYGVKRQPSPQKT